jgi:hypothetical protein
VENRPAAQVNAPSWCPAASYDVPAGLSYLRAGQIARNPVTNSVAPNVRSGKRTTLDLDTAQKLMSPLGDETYGPLIEVALWTRMRKGEFLALR